MSSIASCKCPNPDAIRSNPTEATRRSRVQQYNSRREQQILRVRQQRPGVMPSAACSCSRIRSPRSAAASNSCQPRCWRMRCSCALSVAGRSGSGKNSSGSRPRSAAEQITLVGASSDRTSEGQQHLGRRQLRLSGMITCYPPKSGGTLASTARPIPQVTSPAARRRCTSA
jgi:hypothetical protein